METGKALPVALRDARRIIHSPLVQDRDDETGVLLTSEGAVPPEAVGKHCRWCGEDIEVSLDHGGPAQPGSVQEYLHSRWRLVHCPVFFENDVVIGLGEETASPCWRQGCLSNAEHEARQEPDVIQPGDGR